MSQGNVEVVRQAYDAWNRRDFDRVLEVLDPQIEWTFAGGAVTGLGIDSTYHGHDGVRRFWETFIEPWERISIEVEEMRTVGDRVVALVRFRAIGRGSGVKLDEPFAHVLTFRGSHVIRFEAFVDRTEALEAAGLSE
jgi:ketosteroid isomerase-like protein